MFQQNRVPYTVALEVGGWEVIKQYVAMGLGISIVTAICLTDADRQRLAARSLARWFPPRSYGVVMRKGKFLSAQARVRGTDPARTVGAARCLTPAVRRNADRRVRYSSGGCTTSWLRPR